MSPAGADVQIHAATAQQRLFDSNEFFNKRAGRDIPAFRMNQFGVAAGGPVSLGRWYDGRNRTFLFLNYEGTRWRRGAVYQGSVPTDLERQGDFSQTLNAQAQLIAIFDPATTAANPAGGFVRSPFAGNAIPKSRIDPVGSAIVKFFPIANTPGDAFTHADNYISNAGTRVNKDDGSARIDHSLGANYRMFARFAVTENQLHQPDTFGNPATPGVGANGDILFHYYTGVWDHTITASPTRVFNIRYGFARFFWARQTRSYRFDQMSLGFPDSYVSQLQIPVFPAIGTEGYAGMAGGSFIRTGQDTHSLLPSMMKTTSRHNLKVGADIRLRRNNVWIIGNGGGQFSFTRAMTTGPNPNIFLANSGNSIAAALLGAASSGTVGSAPGASLENWYLAGYIQDDIKLTRNLTLNLGLRYETETLSGLFTYKGGVPLTVSAPIPGGGNRPNSTGESATLDSGRSRNDKVQQWFNTKVFALPASYTYGNVARTLPDTRGPSVTNVDLSLVKSIPIRERVDLQLRAESFNLLNTPHFWLPVTSMASLQFGQLTSSQVTALPRVMQFALKLKF